ncbi:MAG: tRNA 2-thiouridine(34) synthase MnmA, partial [Candidatus Sumerlaeota bacterium]
MSILSTQSRVLVAMSGGVDSSLAAWLLKCEGHDLVGVNMRTHRLSPEEIALGAQIKTCCSPTDAKDARACAERTEFPFYVLDVEEDFTRDVIDPFVQAYKVGRTPNPCVLCNSHVKLGLLLEKAKLWDCTHIATGHYARRVQMPDTGRWTLARALDDNKDQTYFLFGLNQDQLEMLVLPVGELTKAEVRAAARDAQIPTADKPESQEICFIPSNDYRAFLRKRFAQQNVIMPRGKIVSTEGEVLGEHEGIAFYTVGQRKGLGIATGEPMYVVTIDAQQNNVIVGPREAVQFDSLIATDINWMGIAGLNEPRRAFVQIRHRHKAQAATLHPQSNGDVRVDFEEPAIAVAPGQATVFYDDEMRVLGGGWIANAGSDT